MISLNGLPLEELCKKVDFLISVGGDGTLLSVVRKSFKYDKAVLGINLGTLGFLTDISMEQLPKFIEDLKNLLISDFSCKDCVRWSFGRCFM